MIEDVMTIMKKGPQLAAQLDAVKLNTKSVASSSKDATFQFPCLFEDTLPIDMMGSIARKAELTYAAFTEILLSLNPTIDITKDVSIAQYLKKFHQNVKLESVMEELTVPENKVKTYIESVERGDYALFLSPNKKYGVLFNVRDYGTKAMMESHKEFLKEHLHDYDTNMLPIITEDSDFISKPDMMSSVLDAEKESRRLKRDDLSVKMSKEMRPPSLIKDIDVKKTNDMMPYAISVRLMAVNDKKEFIQYMDFVLGIKAIIHPVKSDELVENIIRALKNKNVFFKLLRWTSGEISLFKNIILNIDGIKSMALDRQRGKNPWFNRLSRLSNQKIGMRNFTIPHGLIPNATIVISSYTVDYIKNNYAIDVHNPSVAKKLLSAMFLMGIMIVDDGAGIIDIIYDDGNGFQTYTLESLERDMSMNSNKLGREIGRMISH